MNQKDQGETERSKTPQDGMRTGAGPGEPDDDEGSITSGSPRNLVPVAAVVCLLFFAGVVFYIAAFLGDSDATRDNWWTADAILHDVSTGIFYAGILVGLGTIAAARSKGACRRSIAVASLLSKTGAVIVFLGVAQAVCVVGSDSYGLGWQYEASQIAFRIASRVFEGGLLAGLALICLRQTRAAGPWD